jgi:uncharacterized damage-inducible protein DinB
MPVPTRTLLRTLIACLLALPAAVPADDKPAAPAAAAKPAPPAPFNNLAWAFAKSNLLRSAEKMPEENYGFKPAETVRSFGQIVGHVADSQYYFCSVALGEKNPAKAIEKTKTSKADLVAALKDAIGYCDRAYGGLTDAQGAETTTLFNNMNMPRRDVLTANLMHGVEHYGNLIVYLRMKGLVPPSSEQGMTPEPKKEEAAKPK